MRTFFVAVACVVFLSSCSAVRCFFSGHTSHDMEATPVDPKPAGWAEIDPVDGMKVYAKGEASNPPILLLHELPGLLPETVQFADALVADGYRVYMPLFFGRFGHPASKLRTLAVCPGPSFNCLSSKESRVVRKLRTLRDRIAGDHDRKLGIIGMCLTGGMPLSLVDEKVAAVVLSQPAIPLPFTAAQRRSLGASLDAAEKLPVEILAMRFEKDCLAPAERFETLRASDIPEERLELREIPSNTEKAHSVLTIEGQHGNEEATAALRRTFEFLEEHVKRQR